MKADAMSKTRGSGTPSQLSLRSQATFGHVLDHRCDHMVWCEKSPLTSSLTVGRFVLSAILSSRKKRSIRVSLNELKA